MPVFGISLLICLLNLFEYTTPKIKCVLAFIVRARYKRKSSQSMFCCESYAPPCLCSL